MALTLTPRADLEVFYEADAQRWRERRPHVLNVVDREAFVRFYLNAPSIGFAADGRPIGGIVFDGEQAHIAVLPQWHGRWALLMKPALQWLFRLKREIVVEVEADNERCLRFLDRHGWPRIGAAGEGVRFLLTPLDGRRKTAYPFPSTARPRPAARRVTPDGATITVPPTVRPPP